MLNVSEIFISIQGEGRYAGLVSAFVRLAGCDLRCRWCDTPYALRTSQGEKFTVTEIIQRMMQYPCNHVVITGGEPLIWPDLPMLLLECRQKGRFVTLETNSTQYRPIQCDLVSISPKLASSVPRQSADDKAKRNHERSRLNIAAMQSFLDNHDCQLKFVVCDEKDLEEIEDILSRLQGVKKQDVMLMPQGRTKQQYRRWAPQVAQMCIENGYRFCPRLQIELWGCRRKR